MEDGKRGRWEEGKKRKWGRWAVDSSQFTVHSSRFTLGGWEDGRMGELDA